MAYVVKFAKYQLVSFRRSVLIYYAVLLTTFLLAGGSGNTAATEIFIFVLGLNSFKQSFLFAQANNISRRTFYLGSALALLSLAASVTGIDFILDSLGPTGFGLYPQIYPPSAPTRLLWSFVFFAFLAMLGWMINMIYYRSSPPVKIAVSVAPIFVAWALNFINNWTEGRLLPALAKVVSRSFGFADAIPNPYPAMASFGVLILGILLVNALLMYRAPVK